MGPNKLTPIDNVVALSAAALAALASYKLAGGGSLADQSIFHVVVLGFCGTYLAVVFAISYLRNRLESSYSGYVASSTRLYAKMPNSGLVAFLIGNVVLGIFMLWVAVVEFYAGDTRRALVCSCVVGLALWGIAFNTRLLQYRRLQRHEHPVID